MTVATRTSVELLRFTPQLMNTAKLFDALVRAADASDVELTDTPTYRGDSQLLMLWGPGAPNRFDVMAQHQAAGGHCIVWDAAYWDRQRKFRVSIDNAHPSAWVMRRDWPQDRFKSAGIPVDYQWNPNGHVVIAGIGQKARNQFGDQVEAWETEMAAAVRARWKRNVWYRRKPGAQVRAVPPKVTIAPAGPIGHVLRGASLVITWHSNVAVDAILHGIPVICRDGAAAAVCPSRLGEEDPQPLPTGVRDRFLSNLAWFQWAPDEAVQCWRFLQELLS